MLSSSHITFFFLIYLFESLGDENDATLVMEGLKQDKFKSVVSGKTITFS